MPKPKSMTDRLRAEIIRRGWTGYRLAKESGLNQNTSARFMRAEGEPTIANIERILAALGWDIGPSKKER